MNKYTQMTAKLKGDFNNIKSGLFKVVFSFAISLSLVGYFYNELALLIFLSSVYKAERLYVCFSVCEGRSTSALGKE